MCLTAWPPNGTWCHASYLTAAQQRTETALWAMARSPIFFGGDLRHITNDTLALLTNPIVLELVDASVNNSELSRALPSPGGAWQEGARLPMRPCSSAVQATAQQTWRWVSHGAGASAVVSAYSHGCLNVWDCVRDPGAVVSVDHVCPPTGCNGAANGLWRTVGGTLRSQLGTTGKPLCLDARSELWPCNGSAAQRFELQNVTGGGGFRVRQGGSCLTMPDPGSGGDTGTSPRVWVARGARQNSAVFIALFNRGPTTTTVKAALSEVGEAVGMPTCSRGFAATEAFGRPSLHVTERGTVQAAVGGYDALLFKLVCR